MTIEQIKKVLGTIKKGRIIKVIYTTQKNGYEKITITYVRLGNYYNTKTFKNSGKQPKPNPNQTHLNDCPSIVYNSNTQEHYIQLLLTNNPRLKSKSTYKYLDQEIDKATYDLANPPRKYNPTIIITKNIKDIIQIG